ncbi:hypothetical protein B0H11DRAFT_2096439 [Mycena galericulata]|nr:hypothetical protein B0H11DRAFT_2096439 [Mycena galericulata]
MPGQILFLLISPLSFFSRRTTHVLPLRKYLVRLRANSRQGFESNLHTPLYVYRTLESSNGVTCRRVNAVVLNLGCRT